MRGSQLHCALFVNTSLVPPLQPLNIIFVDSSRCHSASRDFLQFTFFSLLVVVSLGPSPDVPFFSTFVAVRAAFTVYVEGPRSYYQSKNSKPRLQCGHTSDIYSAPPPLHLLQYMLYDPVNTNRSCDRMLWEPFISRIVDIDHVYGQHAAQLTSSLILRLHCVVWDTVGGSICP